MTHSPARSPIDVGSVIAGTYTIEALIGRGGMGAVFLASHARLPGKKVAIKVLHADVSSDEILARFKREAQIASLLSHPNIVHIEDYNITADGMPYLVLEYLQGESLAQRIRRGPMSVESAMSVIRQVGSALAAAHAKGIVHRDLKPQNIFLVPSEIDGRTLEIAKVLDFGISKMRDSQTVKTQDSALLGTPQYMAPEQATGQHDKVDERTDIFALGAIVYEMMSGVPAFSGQTIPEVVFKVVYEQPVELGTRAPTVPDAIKSAVHQAMAKTPEERFRNVSALIEALTGTPVSIIRAPAPPSPAGVDGTGPTSASGRTPITDREAFDKTVSSADHGLAALTAPASTPVDVAARTLDSVSGARAASGGAPAANAASNERRASDGAAGDAISASRTPGGAPSADGVSSSHGAPGDNNAGRGPGDSIVTNASASTVSSGQLAASASEGSRSRTPLAVAGVLAACVAVAAILYVVRREPTPPSVAKATPPAVVAGTQQQPAIVGDPARSQPTPPPVERALLEAPLDAAVAAVTDGGSPADVPAKIAKAATPPSPPHPAPADDEDADDNTRAGQKLKEATAAIARSDWAAAAAAAQIVYSAEDAKPVQRDHATLLKGLIACNTNDDGAAATAYRSLPTRPKMRARLLAACHRNGLLENLRR